MSRTRGHRGGRRDYGEPGCWICLPGAEKKRLIEERLELREVAGLRHVAAVLENGPTCTVCGRGATWFYVPGGEDIDYCDDHVPRGCSCVDDPSEPCIEFHEYEEAR